MAPHPHQQAKPLSWALNPDIFRKNIGWVSLSASALVIGLSTTIKSSPISIPWTWGIAGAVVGSSLTYATLKFLLRQRQWKQILPSDTLPSERRFFDQYLTQRMLERQNMALLLCKIDFFAQFSESYGETVSQTCLEQVYDSLRQSVRKGDLVTRMGPATFIVFLPNTDEHIAIQIAERIRSQVEQLGIPHETSSISQVVTISGGLAFCNKADTITSNEFVEAATQLLSLSKHRGRNQITNRLQGIFAEIPEEEE